MLRPRADIESLNRYEPGRTIEEIARAYGLDEVMKLASNECPLPPFPEVVEAISGTARNLNRYPDNECRIIRPALAAHLDVPQDALLFGHGSSALLLLAALVMGGEGTSAVFAWPSFAVYPIATTIAAGEPIRVPLDPVYRHDLGAMLGAIRDDTTIVYLCNPNNPTGTYLPATQINEFVDSVPDHILIVIDEAYHEFVDAPDHASALPLALERDNVLVTRTFSKVYGLADLRVGYGVAQPDTVATLRKAQMPFTVTNISQAGAAAAIEQADRLAERVAVNRAGVLTISDALTMRGIRHAPSQANFVYFEPDVDIAGFNEALLRNGVIVRVMGEALRVTAGTDGENKAFIAALDAALADAR